MKYDFLISLKRPDYRAINLISQLLLIIFLLAFGRYVLEVGLNKNILIQSLIPLAIIGLWIYTAVRSRQKDFIPYYRLELFMAALGWKFIIWQPSFWWIPFLYAALAIMERFIKFPLEIGFAKEEIMVNSFPKKRYQWVDIENAIIRDNLFTLDFRNNKIIQKELEEPVSKALEQEFNDFCKEMLHFKLAN